MTYDCDLETRTWVGWHGLLGYNTTGVSTYGGSSLDFVLYIHDGFSIGLDVERAGDHIAIGLNLVWLTVNVLIPWRLWGGDTE